uniref:Protein kinase domain-containing protein n=1 Tax=Octactis speculum TaxID=3111310 RepID=A0A7S2GLP9_9STRA|mmetsp:Transcript_52223/g.71273  ORF Transcript_52223/g.71273 Transcript_52223/m.71273 type:complete len:368 (+) Transcript_52223:196-1299(+)|eukprot:CAMPEP_0185744718 /NCGR_PEP_ID=MMETSP1174-20130828/2868_1 /TAXON_ID=35687 /ORGANISM="Dictyocha speculum, Strain CCMP1381" /LENGTH=367 /DNA_ID=CAMNT_0028418273 /DNA_START=196 /DNA_END=1299 /DNA_ORIENTATION=+
MKEQLRRENDELRRSIRACKQRSEVIQTNVRVAIGNCSEFSDEYRQLRETFRNLFFDELLANPNFLRHIQSSPGRDDFLIEENKLRQKHQHIIATRISDGEQCVVKIIRNKRTISDAQRINSEIGILQRLGHPFLNRIYGCWIEPDHMCVVYKHAGRDLNCLMDDYPEGLPERLLHPILRSLVDILAYTHTRGVAHGDLNPQHILVDTNNGYRSITVKVSGFGSILDENLEIHPHLKSFGSPGFAGPEIINGGGWDFMKADAWSLGCVLNAAMIGKRSYDQLWMRIFDNIHLVESEIDRIDFLDGLTTAQRLCAVHWPDTLANVVEACLRIEPRDRPAVRNLFRFESGTWGVLEGSQRSTFSSRSDV